jgi:hypothetical protein
MLGLLQSILCAIQKLGALIVDLAVAAINGLIALIGVILAGLLLLLPNLPNPPSPPSSGVLGLINWAVPLVPMLAFVLVAVTMWVAFLAIKVALNWFRAL